MSRTAPQVMLWLVAVVALNGCNYKGMVINSSFLMVEEAMASFYEEPDTVLAAQAAPANLKLIEGMARGAPENEDIQLAAAQMTGMYAFGFLEDQGKDDEEQDGLNSRARRLYARGVDYARRALGIEDWKGFSSLPIEEFEQRLLEFEKEDVPALFWTGFNWGLYINVSRSDMTAIKDLPRIKAIADRLLDLDPSYFYGGAYMMLMVYNGVLGPALGGSPEKTRDAFEKAWKVSDGRYLMTKFVFVRYYTLQTMDEQLFNEMLEEIISAPDDLLAEQNLANALAKDKARILRSRSDDIF